MTAKTGRVLVMQMQLLPYWKQLHDQSRPKRAGCRHFLPWFVSYVLPNTNKIRWRMYFDESIESVLKDMMMRCFLLCEVLSHLQASCPSLDFCLLSCLVWPFCMQIWRSIGANHLFCSGREPPLFHPALWEAEKKTGLESRVFCLSG